LIFSIVLTSHCILPVMLDRRRRPRGSSPKSDKRFSTAGIRIQLAEGIAAGQLWLSFIRHAPACISLSVSDRVKIRKESA
jgi:hypothetical protein